MSGEIYQERESFCSVDQSLNFTFFVGFKHISKRVAPFIQKQRTEWFCCQERVTLRVWKVALTTSIGKSAPSHRGRLPTVAVSLRSMTKGQRDSTRSKKISLVPNYLPVSSCSPASTPPQSPYSTIHLFFSRCTVASGTYLDKTMIAISNIEKSLLPSRSHVSSYVTVDLGSMISMAGDLNDTGFVRSCSVYTGILFSKNCFKVTKFDKIYFFVL